MKNGEKWGKMAFLGFFLPYLTVSIDGQIYLGPLTSNGHLGLKTISSHSKLDVKAMKTTYKNGIAATPLLLRSNCPLLKWVLIQNDHIIPFR